MSHEQVTVAGPDPGPIEAADGDVLAKRPRVHGVPLSPELIDMVSLVGPKDRVRDRLQAYREAGVGTLISTPLAFTMEDRSRMMRELAEMAA